MGARQLASIGHDHLRGFEQTPLSVRPRAGREQPVLEDQTNQFGIDLTEDAGRILGPPFIHSPMALPQFEDQFDLPADFQQDHGFGQAEFVGRNIRDHHRPPR